MFPKITPVIRSVAATLFERREWLYELKHDGFHALAYLGDGQYRLISRRGNEMKRFADFVIAKERKVKDAIVDGESLRWTVPASELFTTC